MVAIQQSNGLPASDLLYLSSADIERLQLSNTDVLETVTEMFRQKALGRVEMPPKPGIHPTQTGFIHAMPAYVPGMHAAGVKWISAFPENTGTPHPQVAGLIIVNDPATGLATAVMDCAWITALRTAAASGIAARCLASKDSSVIGIVGCGVQGRSHLAVFNELFPLQEAIAYDVNQKAVDAYAEEMSDLLQIRVHAARSPRDAVASPDLVITAGPITQPAHGTLDARWLKPDAFASSVDFASYWAPESISAFGQICTDDVPQFNKYRGLGYFEGFPETVMELADLLIDPQPTDPSSSGRSFACNLGIAAEDVVVARVVLERARALGIGTLLSR